MKRLIKGEDMKRKSGFTIIEVVLVLAIAGLIFLMVFIALPALQRSQRDTQREDDIARAQTAIVNYQKVNRGNIPSFTETGAKSWGSCGRDSGTDAESEPSGFCARYLLVGGDTFEDPDGTPYAFRNGGDLKSSSTLGEEEIEFNHDIYVYTNATCDGENAITSTGSRKVALRYSLEGGGILCVNN